MTWKYLNKQHWPQHSFGSLQCFMLICFIPAANVKEVGCVARRIRYFSCSLLADFLCLLFVCGEDSLWRYQLHGKFWFKVVIANSDCLCWCARVFNKCFTYRVNNITKNQTNRCNNYIKQKQNCVWQHEFACKLNLKKKQEKRKVYNRHAEVLIPFQCCVCIEVMNKYLNTVTKAIVKSI